MTRSKRPVQPLDFSLGGARRRHQDGGSDGDRSDSRQASRKIRHHWFVRSCLSMNSHCGVPFGPKYPQTLPNVGEKPGKRIRWCFPFFEFLIRYTQSAPGIPTQTSDCCLWSAELRIRYWISPTRSQRRRYDCLRESEKHRLADARRGSKNEMAQAEASLRFGWGRAESQ